jgi:hypothetical protein
MTQDALTVLNDIPFSIPPYFALLARAIVTLEGIALTGDPNYGIIMESYPFVARKLLKEDRPEIQRALQQVLYAKNIDNNGDDLDSENGKNGLRTTRLTVLLNSALGIVAKTSKNAFIDFDSIPEGSITLNQALKFILSDSASSLRTILIDEATLASDILLRQGFRKSYNQIISNLPMPPLFGRFLPRFETLTLPFFVPRNKNFVELNMNLVEEEKNIDKKNTDKKQQLPRKNSNLLNNFNNNNNFATVFLTSNQFIDIATPKLTREEELYALSLKDLTSQSFGDDAAVVINGNALLDPSAATRFLLEILSSGKLPGDLNSFLSPTVVKNFSNQVLKPVLLDKNKNLRLISNKNFNLFSVIFSIFTRNTKNSNNKNDNGNNNDSSNQNKMKIDSNNIINNSGIKDLTDGLNELSKEEVERLQNMLNIVFNRLQNKIFTRLQTKI